MSRDGYQSVTNVKLGHVLAELLDTERVYVAEINVILKVGTMEMAVKLALKCSPNLLIN